MNRPRRNRSCRRRDKFYRRCPCPSCRWLRSSSLKNVPNNVDHRRFFCILTRQCRSKQGLVRPFHHCQRNGADDVITFVDLLVGTGDLNSTFGIPGDIFHLLLESKPILRNFRVEIADQCRITRWEFHVRTLGSLIRTEFSIGHLFHRLTSTFTCLLIESAKVNGKKRKDAK